MTREETKRRNKAVSIFNILLKGQRTYVPPEDAQYAYRTAIEYLNKYKPTVEPQAGEWEVYEVLHGEWEGTKKYRCSRCKYKVGVFNTNFCPECGLKMSNGKSWEHSNMRGKKESNQ